MKAIDIALKDMLQSLRSTIAVVFMFGLPLMVTGMYSLMFGNIARRGEFDLPRIQVVIANLDEGGPNLGLNGKNVPGDIRADTLGELVVKVLQSKDLAKLIEVGLAADAASARHLVDSQQAQVALIIPPDFSKQFADPYGQAVIDFYQDPTLTISPRIVRSILNQFMDGLAGVKIAADIAIDQFDGSGDHQLVGLVIQGYLDDYMTQDDDLAASLLESYLPDQAAGQAENPVIRLLAPIMGGMMIFYAFYTGTNSAESILREEETHTLPRLFTTPTSQTTILSGKFLAVFLTVLVQVVVLLIASHLIFGIAWGDPLAVAAVAVGTVFSASSMGILINSMLKNTRHGGVVFGGVLTVSGMLGMTQIFAINAAETSLLKNVIPLLVPQGWALKGLMLATEASPPSNILLTSLVSLGWGLLFLVIGVWRFNRRYR